MGLFKGRLDISKAFETVTGGVDKAIFTPEERADLNKGVAQAQVNYIKTTVSENSIRSVTRRYLSVGIVGVFLLLLIAAAVAFPFSADYAKFLLDLALTLNTLVMMVAAFFFGGYYAKKFVDSRRNAKSNNQNDETSTK